jgi:hypothetical protein
VTTTPSAWIIAGPVIAAVITGLVAIFVLLVNQYQARRDRRSKDFAAALAAVERYSELPYRILRRQDSTPEARGRVAEVIHEVQQDLLFHKSWARIQTPRVADAYDSLLKTTRREAGSAMTEAWRKAPIKTDEDMPLGIRLDFPQMKEERAKYIEAVSRELEFPLSRWAKESLLPWLLEHLHRKGSTSS